MTGNRRTSRSRRKRPAGLRFICATATTTRTTASASAHHHVSKKLATSSNTLVTVGSWASNSLKNSVNFGRTYPTRITTVTIAITKITSGYVSAERTFCRASASRSMYFDSWSSTESRRPVISAERRIPM